MAKPHDALRKRMKEHHMLVDDLAALIGRAPSYTSLRLNGRAPWLMSEVYRIVDELGIDRKQIWFFFPENGKNIDRSQLPDTREAERIMKIGRKTAEVFGELLVGGDK